MSGFNGSWNPLDWSWGDIGNDAVDVAVGAGKVAGAVAAGYSLYKVFNPPSAPKMPVMPKMPSLPSMPSNSFSSSASGSQTAPNVGSAHVAPVPVDVGAIYKNVQLDSQAASKAFILDEASIAGGTSSHEKNLRKRRADVHTDRHTWDSFSPHFSTNLGGTS